MIISDVNSSTGLTRQTHGKYGYLLHFFGEGEEHLFVSYHYDNQLSEEELTEVRLYFDYGSSHGRVNEVIHRLSRQAGLDKLKK